MEKNVVEQLTKDLIVAYTQLNGPAVDELDDVPSPLEFSRYVGKNRPFVVRGAVSHWPAVQRWDKDYLQMEMGEQQVNVAITPSGNADSFIKISANGQRFIKPYEIEERFIDFLHFLSTQTNDAAGIVKYAQTQNDNLRDEYAALFKDIDKDIPWARIALRKKPEAINLWIGNSRSVTALHKDNYENIYCQIIGEKHFVLLPPVMAACVNEQLLQQATYAPGSKGLVIADDEPKSFVPFPTWDPDEPNVQKAPLSHLGIPLRVTLRKGDLLYLPAQWFHKVSQTCGPQGICCAVNYWYDMDFDGPLYALNSFVRSLAVGPSGGLDPV